MRVLVACEESQAVCIAFREKGHEAFSCDIQECSGGHPEWHYQRDIFDVIGMGWDLMIAHPPCTYLTVTANTWLRDQPKRKSGNLVGEERRAAKQESIEFFLSLYNCNIKKIAIENPIGCMSSVFRKPDQIIHPSYFGDSVSKSTCLWLKGLPKLVHTKENNLFFNKTHVEPEFYTTATGKKYPKWSMIDACKISDLKERAKFRSKTFPGIAKAMADQWG
jgi:hypothetical protein